MGNCIQPKNLSVRNKTNLLCDPKPQSLPNSFQNQQDLRVSRKISYEASPILNEESIRRKESLK